MIDYADAMQYWNHIEIYAMHVILFKKDYVHK